MSACNFSIPFTGSAEKILDKAKSTVEGQGGTFNGDETQGNFDVSVFGNSVSGSYNVGAQNLEIIIESKPFLVPCSVIESFLTKQLN